MYASDISGECPAHRPSGPAKGTAPCSPAMGRHPLSDLSVIRALQGLLDAAEQRNAEERPSGARRFERASLSS